ncbi:reverse transcriptase domain-containing protein [Tanacetum coccineum]
MIGSDLTEKTRSKLCNLLQRSLDILAWTLTDMTGLPRQIAKHKLNVRKGCQPVRQKKRGQAAERNVVINDEVSKLVTAGIMREVHYHDWLSNPVMVKKSDNSWRMCVDFKDLNKACLKDGYPLPEIDWKVESLCGFPFKCFLDAYKGYHQIQMAEEDEEKTAFITNQGIFCYTKMPFSLRNVGATYQRLVDKTFHGQIGKNLEVYVDDLVIKSRTEDEVFRDIEETFKTLRKINMKLNPKKCTFGVEEGMFLGYQVNTKGIKICSEKEAEAAFKQMKEHIAKLLMVTAPEEQEELIVYLAASKEAVSAVLMTEKEVRQMPIYFVSRALRGPEVNYTAMEKLVLALVHASKMLRRYFQAHPITVITDQPIKNVLSNPKVAGRMQKWSIQLGMFGIHYRPRVSVKGQVLADFIVERPEEEEQDDSIKEEEPLPARWTLFMDGSSCVDGCGAGVILTDPEGVEFTYALRFYPKKQEQKSGCTKQNGVHQLCTSQQTGVGGGIERKSVNEREVLTVVEEEGNTWMTPIHEYLTDETLPAERQKARAIKRKSQRFAIINGILYKKSFLGPWLRCVGPSQANYVLREIHEGSCSMHAGTRSVVAKTLRTGYYWPTMHKDARALIKASGPFPEGPGKVKFLIVAMDYFTKWIEAKPVATITGNQVKKFVWENIVCRFGLPGEIISDNGKQFRDNPFKDWCEKLCIQQHFTSVKHPQTNELVERANRSLGEGIKARLGKDNKNWLEEISHVLWAHRTMIKSSNGDTPFSLTYGTEAVIPAEIGMPTFRTAEVDVAKNDEALEINLELLEERREQAAIREAKSKRQMEKYYNTKVRNASFKPGDLVYRSNEASRVEDTGKLGPKWEGPYEVTEALGKGSYKLKDRNGKELPRTWNVCNLKKCYIHKV